MFANKNGLMYIIDRSTGELLLGKPFVRINWFAGFDTRGRPTLSQTAQSEWIPTSLGATNWHPASFSPATGLYYVSARERRDHGPGNGFGAIRAIDPTSGDVKWEFVVPDAMFNSGILTTGSNLLFAGTTGDNNSGPSASRQVDGCFYALDARTGVQLWRTSLAASVHGSPISYVAGGTQYIAVSAGNSLSRSRLGAHDRAGRARPYRGSGPDLGNQHLEPVSECGYRCLARCCFLFIPRALPPSAHSRMSAGYRPQWRRNRG